MVGLTLAPDVSGVGSFLVEARVDGRVAEGDADAAEGGGATGLAGVERVADDAIRPGSRFSLLIA